MDYAKIESAVEIAATDNDAFLVELELKPNNIIVAFVDSDNGLTIEQIKMINRQIESHLDRDVEEIGRASCRERV